MYKQEKTLKERKEESSLMITRFENRIPIIVEKRKKEIMDIDKRKYMAPKTLTNAQFIFVIRRRLSLKPEQAIFIYANDQLITGQGYLNDLYMKHRDEDGFLYIIYDFENVFGTTK